MYAVALEEIKSGLKRSHWMWYIFRSCVVWARVQWRTYTASQGFRGESVPFSPVLSARLMEISEALLMLKKKNPEDIFGQTDAMKLRPSMTLFAIVSDDGSGFMKYYCNKPQFCGIVPESLRVFS